jgi:hypothetical protein
MKRKIRGAAQSFIIALVIVTVATVALVFFEDTSAQPHWPAVAAPIIPAVYILASFFTGGAHGMGSVPRYQQAIAVFGIALTMWWILVEGCRIAWGFVLSPPRRRKAATTGRPR